MYSQSIRTLKSSTSRQLPSTVRSLSTIFARMSNMDKSHATGGSKVPGKVQEKAPKGLEESLPESVHPTSKNPMQSANKTHAKGGGEESILPKKVQEAVPEGIEKAVPNVLHNTGDK
ncbi:hypothetical protein F4818DRAFT_405198 [Hypoxylon cercidicola]|nr:hypothetical protein F4818DRAFT_405198 [Hypoxylon cercidicola]